MSQENVDIVRRVYEAVARGDSAAVLALYDEHDDDSAVTGARRGRARKTHAKN